LPYTDVWIELDVQNCEESRIIIIWKPLSLTM